MNFVGMLRIRNEARWIGRVIESLLPLCSRVFILDDHSDDGTPDICRTYPQVTLFPSPFDGLNEARDKDYLLALVKPVKPDIIVAIDGDEVLEDEGPQKIREWVKSGNSWSFRVMYLWDTDDQIRLDGVYSRMWRPSMFRLSAVKTSFQKTPFGNGANLHCSSVPYSLITGSILTGVRLWHLGYRDREDRLRKYEYYNRIDPQNKLEDSYRHIVQGDVPEVPASEKLRWAGPLTLQRLPVQEKQSYAAR